MKRTVAGNVAEALVIYFRALVIFFLQNFSRIPFSCWWKTYTIKVHAAEKVCLQFMLAAIIKRPS